MLVLPSVVLHVQNQRRTETWTLTGNPTARAYSPIECGGTAYMGVEH